MKKLTVIALTLVYLLGVAHAIWLGTNWLVVVFWPFFYLVAFILMLLFSLGGGLDGLH